MHYTLHMTTKCNLRCSYCYVDHVYDGIDMTFDTARAAVELAGKNNKRAGFVFFGGEPLLFRKLIYDTVAYARSREQALGCAFSFKMTTNGLLLDDEFIKFAAQEAFFIAISLDGTKTAHNLHRKDTNGKDSYDRVADAAKRLLAVMPLTPALMTVSPDTLRLYAEGVESLFNLGFSFVVPSLDYSADWQDSNVTVLRQQYEQLTKLYERKTLRGDKFYFHPFESKISSHVNSKTYCRERCELGLRQLSVGPDGIFYPCVQFVGDARYALGDVRNGIDEAARQALYTHNEKEKAGCDICTIRTRCNHYCACLNKQSTGSVEEVAPMLCAHERTVLPIADKLAERLYQKGNAAFIHKQYVHPL